MLCMRQLRVQISGSQVHSTVPLAPHSWTEHDQLTQARPGQGCRARSDTERLCVIINKKPLTLTNVKKGKL